MEKLLLLLGLKQAVPVLESSLCCLLPTPCTQTSPGCAPSELGLPLSHQTGVSAAAFPEEHCQGKSAGGRKLESELLGRVWVIGGTRHRGALGTPRCREAPSNGEPGSRCLSTPGAQLAHLFTASNKCFCSGTTLAFLSTLTLQLIP